MSNATPEWLINYCNSSFLDPNLIYNPNPEFSACFQEIALVWGPCFFLWLFAIPKLLVLFNTNGKPLPSSPLHIAKLLITICIFIVMVIELGYVAANKTSQDFLPADVVSPAIFAATMVLVFFLQILYRIKGQVGSGLLWLFWLALVGCQCLTLVSLAQSAADGYIKDMLSFVTFHVFYFFALVAFILSSFAEPSPNKKEKDCPELSSSFLNQILFWWFNPIVWMGYKKALVHGDLWKLNESDMTKVSAPKLNRHWEYELNKSRKSRKVRDPSKETTVYANIGLEDVVIEQNQKSYDMKEKYYKPSLVKAMAKTYGKTMFIAALYKLGNDTIQFLSPILMSKMIAFTEDESIDMWIGYVYAASMYVVTVVQAIFLNQYFHRCMIAGMNIRTGVINMVYKKSLRISNEARKESTVGEIVNLMSTDAQRFMDLMSYIQILWSGPYVIVLCLFLLYQQLGPSVFAGFALMIVLIPINGAITAFLRKMSIKNMALKDKRIKLMNEILNGVKVLKLYAWEESFEDQVTKVRNEELKLAKKIAYLRALLTFAWTVAPFMVAFVTFTVFVYSDESNILDSSKAFVSTTLFNILRFPLVMLPAMISAVVQAQVSVNRLTKFLTNKEIDTQAVDRSPSPDGKAVEIKDGTFAWESDGDIDLKDINMSVEKGSLVAVVGAVGSGKSSLISAMLGDMEKKDGYVGIHGSVAYVPQTAWIQNDTLKENILFGKSLLDDSQQSEKLTNDSEKIENGSAIHDSGVVSNGRYKSIIKATALGPDLDILPGGDKTEIGEKGINLSGGQKQRVSLARAICSDADIYLLDDPLSAVDSHIGKHIFENVIGKTGLLDGKTRILVTHGIQYLTQVDWIFVMDQGVISEAGTYQELVESGEKFSKFLEEYANDEDSDESDAEENDVFSDDEVSTIADPADMNAGDMSSLPGDRAQLPDTNGMVRRTSSRRSARSKEKMRHKSVTSNGRPVSRKSRTSKGGSIRNRKNPEWKKEGKSEEGTKLTTVEGTEEGTVKAGVYLEYMKSIGVWYCLLIIVMGALYQAAYVGASTWLSDWTAENDQLAPNETSDNLGLRVGVYGAFGVFQGIFIYGSGISQAIATIAAARSLHYDMLKNILRVPTQFFDTTPLGRIVNRFAKDTYTVDEMLPQTIRMWLSCFFSVLGTLVVIIYATPIFAAVIVPIAILYYFGQRYYVATSRQLKRIESVTRSPIYSHFGETVSGVSVIRAFEQNERFIAESEARVDKNQECYYPNIVSNRWLSVRLEIVGNAIVFFAALFAVLSRDTIGGAVAGLSLSYALSVTSTLNWWVRQMSELETNVVAVERVREYAQVEREADWEIPGKKPDSEWPGTGVVKFQNYSTRYRENLDLVLKGIDCALNSGEKVGIVGRTGAGKSSLTLALFRLIEAAGGKIVIDDVDISSIGLHDLRKKLTIIPQDPVLFSGTMRLNIDPFEYYSDDEIWSSLEHAHLKEYVAGLPDKLDHICAEGGENLSVGQRQLVCLARALLRKSKILVLDEATAAVDMQTDDLIQQTIRNEFTHCTVITIAHRLNTILDYDKIMVLDEGKIAEFASPEDLLQQKGVFYGMVKDAGLA